MAVCLSAVGLAACGSGGPRQDANEPSGKFPVQIVTSKFRNFQRLAQTSDLRLGVKNIGTQTIPDLAITISTDPNADESFSIHSTQQGLAIPSRPVWVLDNGYPKLAGQTAPAGADVAQTKTYGFGPVPAGATKEMVWRLAPVIAGTFTINYKVAAGLNGKARAVTADGAQPQGEFVVKISDVPEQTEVDNAGNVVPINPNSIVGQAGHEKKKQAGGK